MYSATITIIGNLVHDYIMKMALNLCYCHIHDPWPTFIVGPW